MTQLETKLNARSADFQANASAMRALVDDLRAQFAKVEQGGGEAARAKHTARGKLLPRDRVAELLDPGTPFLEIAPLAAHAMYLDGKGVESAPGAASWPPFSGYMPSAASGAISRKGVPGSSSSATRSRGSSLPRAVCLARAASPPPCSTFANCVRRSSTSARMAAALAWKSAERALSLVSSWLMLFFLG